MSSKNVTNRIISYIAQNISEGTWKTGERIASENEICQALNVGRMSVRNALQHFIALGVLESRQGKGTFLLRNDVSALFGESHVNETLVKSPETIADMKHLLQFRALLEPEICEVVAPTMPEEVISHLEALLALMQRAIADTNAFVNADMEFHITICRSYGNPIVDTIMEEIERSKLDSYTMLNHTVGSYGGLYYHSLLLDAFKKHDGKRARSVMREHLEHSIGDLDLGAEPEKYESKLS